MGKIYRKYTREILVDAVASSDTSHFVRHQNGSTHDPRRLTAADILVNRPPGSPRTKPPFLRRALSEIGRPYSCVTCGNTGEWQGAPLRLHVDHIDGNFHNNLAANVRYLCPNCHSQTPNFAGLSKGKLSGVRPHGSGVAAGTPALD